VLREERRVTIEGEIQRDEEVAPERRGALVLALRSSECTGEGELVFLREAFAVVRVLVGDEVGPHGWAEDEGADAVGALER